MLRILGHSIDNLPIKDLKKISDLLDYEGPILSHFVDDRGRNYLFYWVDYDTDYNRWLVWRVSELQLYNYLFGTLSLREVLLEPNKEFIYIVDIDANLKYDNIKMLPLEDLNPEYLPEEESFLSSLKIQEYQDLIDKYKQNEYLSFLRKNSIYFTLEPKKPTFSTTVSSIDASIFLKKLTHSFWGFIEYDFYNSFKNSISDILKIQKIIKQFKEILTPRVVDLQFSSFKVALSADTIQSVESNKFKQWQSAILDKYKDEVIETDLNSEDVLHSIAERYPLEARKNIYSPIVEIINDKNFNLKISDHKRKLIKKFNPINKKQEEILIPKEKIIDETKENKILLNLIVEVSDKEDINQIGKRELQTGLLFTQEVDEFHIGFETMETATAKVSFRKPVECDIRLKNNIYYFSILDFPVKYESKVMEDGKRMIQSKFIEFYLDVQENPQNFEKDLTYRLNSVIDRFIKL